ncbi:ADYC domain-containing protein [Nannocystis bainbridge]|uniref:ADYC domain-containing protein n=1 Tax=Nannocystis bainbridge TaxID=2995303 RepID=A0ABT5DPP6_9BACT|nr:ADYC domain-containing protein [Nannocystis bainbridge]MDC0715632.1 ADYC domain-containing protein [Nannocystis bainbridge]
MLAADKLLFAASLSLVAACDSQDLAAFQPEEEVELRCAPNCPPASGNTEWMGSLYPISPLDTLGNDYRGIKVESLVVAGYTAAGFGAFEGELWADIPNPHFGTIRLWGQQLLGARFTLTFDGKPRYLTISAVQPPPAGDSHWLYGLKWDDDGPDPGDDTPACLKDQVNGEQLAIVHDDLDIDTATGDVFARANTVYFACLHGAAGKATLEGKGFNFGFRPFELGLANFEISLRFILADYCGDGHSWTQDKTNIHYQDLWNIGAGGGLTTDAVWGQNGALCIGAHPRVYDYDEIECPLGVKPPLCGTPAQTQTLFNNQGVIWSRNPWLIPIP